MREGERVGAGASKRSAVDRQAGRRGGADELRRVGTIARSGDLHAVVAEAPHPVTEAAASLDGGKSGGTRGAAEGPWPHAIAHALRTCVSVVRDVCVGLEEPDAGITFRRVCLASVGWMGVVRVAVGRADRRVTHAEWPGRERLAAAAERSSHGHDGVKEP